MNYKNLTFINGKPYHQIVPVTIVKEYSRDKRGGGFFKWYLVKDKDGKEFMANELTKRKYKKEYYKIKQN